MAALLPEPTLAQRPVPPPPGPPREGFRLRGKQLLNPRLRVPLGKVEPQLAIRWQVHPRKTGIGCERHFPRLASLVVSAGLQPSTEDGRLRLVANPEGVKDFKVGSQLDGSLLGPDADRELDLITPRLLVGWLQLANRGFEDDPASGVQGREAVGPLGVERRRGFGIGIFRRRLRATGRFLLHVLLPLLQQSEQRLG